ncbi:MAG: L,D-transpeptidase [Acidobacteria bacterium]|nr:L,D-transpeptidase [Acidobacteriota bacterium]
MTASVGTVLVLWLLIVLAGGIIAGRQSVSIRESWADSLSETVSSKDLEKKSASIRASMDRLAPRGNYIIIDTGRNILFLKNGDRILREAVVSCGSGSILIDPSGQRSWIFDTPRGVFSVTSLLRRPVWIKPDWAFLEEGRDIPTNLNDRAERGTLGDYALGFGQGYFIHGTLYTRLLGRNVTHGCVRVGDDDLEYVFDRIRIGTSILIY